MVKRVLSIVLALCLMLALFPVASVSAGGAVTVFSEKDFYDAFPAKDGVVTIPEDTMVMILADDITIEETLVVSKNSMFVISIDRSMFIGGDLINCGNFNVDKGAFLTVGGKCVNNFSLNVLEQSMFFPMGGLTNNHSFALNGIYGCVVYGAHDDDPLMITYSDMEDPQDEHVITSVIGNGGSVILMDGDEEHPADMGAAADMLRNAPKAAENGFYNAAIYGFAHDTGEMIAFNNESRLDGIYVEGRGEEFMIPISEDINIKKKLCVGPCDLVLQNGKTLTVLKKNLLFRENGRIVCESEGAAGPDCLAGGTLVLSGKAVLSGDPAKGPVNPTEDIVWLTSTGDENGRYPAVGNAIFVGDTSGADVHDSCGSLTVIMGGRTSHIKLTDDFTCSDIMLNGETDLNGNTLYADNVFYANDSHIFENGGQIIGTPNYEVIADAGVFGHFEDRGKPEGARIYLGSDMGLPVDDIIADPCFMGWRFDSGWDIPEEELRTLEVKVDDEKEEDKYYIAVPAYPIIMFAEWDTMRVELTKYCTTVAFDGIKGHDYSMNYVDSVNSTDAEIAGFGVDRAYVNNIVDKAADMAGGDVLNLISFWLFDGEHEITDQPFEMRVVLPDIAKEYDTVKLKIVHIDGVDDVHVDPATVDCRVEEGVLIAELDRNESAFIVVGCGPQVIDRVKLSLKRPVSGTVTDTPKTPDGNDWERHNQSMKPHVDYINGPGAYVESTLWVLPGEGDIPFVGTFENGKPYTFTIVVNAEPDWCFADDVEIVIDGAQYVSHTVHIDDNRGAADILFITATMKPLPTNVHRGDTDDDKEVTIIDATYIQRELAGLSNLRFVDEAADVDGDHEISIFDATAIQRYLAGLDDGYPIGEEIRVS